MSFLITESESAEKLPQELARVTVVGQARQIDDEAAEHTPAMARYLERFPESEPMFGFGDFSLFAIRPAEIGGSAGSRAPDP